MAKQNQKKEKQNKRKKRRWLKALWRSPKIVRGVIIAILSILSFFISFFWVPGEIHYRIRETYSFTPDEAGVLNLAALLPTSGANQVVSDPKVEWPGNWQASEDGRLQVIRMEAKALADETVKAVITYQVTLTQGTARWVDEPVNDEDINPSADVQSDAPEIIAQAELLGIEGDETRTLRLFHEFTGDYLEKTKDNPADHDESALTAYQTGIAGDLGEANLLAALSRASGLPAKIVNGLKLPEMVPLIPVSTAGESPADSGFWAEVFYEEGWGMIDPGEADGFYRPAVFGWNDGKHLTYGEVDQVNRVYQELQADDDAEKQWKSSSLGSLHYVAWADVDQVEIVPKVSILKTWDARWVMLVSLIAIILIIAWLMRDSQHTK